MKHSIITHTYTYICENLLTYVHTYICTGTCTHVHTHSFCGGGVNSRGVFLQWWSDSVGRHCGKQERSGEDRWLVARVSGQGPPWPVQGIGFQCSEDGSLSIWRAAGKVLEDREEAGSLEEQCSDYGKLIGQSGTEIERKNGSWGRGHPHSRAGCSWAILSESRRREAAREANTVFVRFQRNMCKEAHCHGG